jgi:hypothetical protein
VQAKGTVSRVRVDRSYPNEPQLVDLATGRARRVGDTLDVWWDPKSGLVRVVGSIAGRTEFDTVGQRCQEVVGKQSFRFCEVPPPFGLRQQGFFLPVKPKHSRIAGHGTVRGRRVVWVETISPTGGSVDTGGRVHREPTGQRVGLDARTHQPVAYQSVFGFKRHRYVSQDVYTRLPDLPASRVSFVVPDGGASVQSYPPGGSPVIHAERSSVARAVDTLGRPPLWLGQSYLGHRLRSVKVGKEGEDAVHGPTLRPVPFVRLDYGIVVLKEFGAQRPWWFEDGPPAGKLLARDDDVTFVQDGVFVNARWYRANSSSAVARALALAKALQPVANS